MAKHKVKKPKKHINHKEEERLEEKIYPGIHKKIRKIKKGK